MSSCSHLETDMLLKEDSMEHKPDALPVHPVSVVQFPVTGHSVFLVDNGFCCFFK